MSKNKEKKDREKAEANKNQLWHDNQLTWIRLSNSTSEQIAGLIYLLNKIYYPTKKIYYEITWQRPQSFCY